jgi:hypothetical protein
VLIKIHEIFFSPTCLLYLQCTLHDNDDTFTARLTKTLDENEGCVSEHDTVPNPRTGGGDGALVRSMITNRYAPAWGCINEGPATVRPTAYDIVHTNKSFYFVNSPGGWMATHYTRAFVLHRTVHRYL